jgi:hypothetical protein
MLAQHATTQLVDTIDFATVEPSSQHHHGCDPLPSMHYQASKLAVGCCFAAATFCFLTAGSAAAATPAAAADLLLKGASNAGPAMYLPTPDRTGAAVAEAPGFENQLLRRLSGSSGLPASACGNM